MSEGVFDYGSLTRGDIDMVAAYYGISVVTADYRNKGKPELEKEIVEEDRKSTDRGHAPGYVVINKVAALLGKPTLGLKKGRKRKSRS